MPAGVVVGVVSAVDAHPTGEYIRLAQVDIGLGDRVQIVFGGPDLVTKGDFVPVALPGTRLPGRKKMRRTKFRGQVSHGMFCSTTELGWEANGRDEVALLKPRGLAPGASLASADLKVVRFTVTPRYVWKRSRWRKHLRNAAGTSITAKKPSPFLRLTELFGQRVRLATQSLPMLKVSGGANVHVQHVSGGCAALLETSAGIDWSAVVHPADGERLHDGHAGSIVV